MVLSAVMVSVFLTVAPPSGGEAASFYSSGVVVEPLPRSSITSVVFTSLFAFYSTFASPVDNKECIFSPTCSRYAREAIAKYGFIRAYPLITARLLRCNPSAYNKGYYPPAKRNDDVWKAYDPIP